jgi:hypothetical protein
MGDVVRVQINIPKLVMSPQNLVNFIISKFGEMDYTPFLSDYKYQKGKTPEEITQVQFKIKASKDIDDYTKFLAEIELTTDKAKILKDGKTKISGESKLVFQSTAITDYDNRWKGNPWLFFLKKIYDKYFYNNKLIQLEDKAEEELYLVIDSVKELLKVK